MILESRRLLVRYDFSVFYYDSIFLKYMPIYRCVQYMIKMQEDIFVVSSVTQVFVTLLSEVLKCSRAQDCDVDSSDIMYNDILQLWFEA